MSITAEKVVSEALELPHFLRAFVAEKLIESLDAPEVPKLSAKWKTKLRRRCAEVDRGDANLRAADAVFKKAYASIAGISNIQQGISNDEGKTKWNCSQRIRTWTLDIPCWIFGRL